MSSRDLWDKPSGCWERILVKQRRRLASRMHPDKGGDAVQYQEMQKAAEVLLEAARAWKAMANTFGTVCIQCHCSLCLDFCTKRIGMCSLCLGVPRRCGGHSARCGLSKSSSYFMRYHKDCNERGRYYMLLAHGASEEMAKETIAADAAKKRKRRSCRNSSAKPRNKKQNRSVLNWTGF